MKKLFVILALLSFALHLQAEKMTKEMETPYGNKVYTYEFTLNKDGKTATVTNVTCQDYYSLFFVLAIPDTLEANGKKFAVTDIGNGNENIAKFPYESVVYLPKTTRRVNKFAFPYNNYEFTLEKTIDFYFSGAEIDFLHLQSGVAPIQLYLTRELSYAYTNAGKVFDLVIGENFNAEELFSTFNYLVVHSVRGERFNRSLSYLPLSNCINLHVSPKSRYYEEKNGCLYHRGCNDTILSIIATTTETDAATVVIPKEVKAIKLPRAGFKFSNGKDAPYKPINIAFEDGIRLEELNEYVFAASRMERQPKYADVIRKHAFYQAFFPNDSVLVVPVNASIVEKNAYEKASFGLAEDGVKVFWSENPECAYTRQNITKKEIHLYGTNQLYECCFADTAIKAIYLNRKCPPEILNEYPASNTGGRECYRLFWDGIEHPQIIPNPVLYVPVGSLQYYKNWWLEDRVREWPFEIPGDLNGDGNVDVTDVNIAIDIVLGNAGLNAKADLNGDGEVDFIDVSKIVDFILGKQ